MILIFLDSRILISRDNMILTSRDSKILSSQDSRILTFLDSRIMTSRDSRILPYQGSRILTCVWTLHINCSTSTLRFGLFHEKKPHKNPYCKKNFFFVYTCQQMNDTGWCEKIGVLFLRKSTWLQTLHFITKRLPDNDDCFSLPLMTHANVVEIGVSSPETFVARNWLLRPSNMQV